MSSDPLKLQRIDDITRGGHYYLDKSDFCFFLEEYYAEKGYQHSAANQRIYNIKKSPQRKGLIDYKYKVRDINWYGDRLRKALPESYFDGGAAFIPIPPSKARNDPDYDDRMIRIARRMCVGYDDADVRDLIIQTQTLEAAHKKDEKRLTPTEQASFYSVDKELLAERPLPKLVVILDDVLTTGSHYKAAEAVILQHAPNCTPVGVFLARCIHPDPLSYFADFDDA